MNLDLHCTESPSEHHELLHSICPCLRRMCRSRIRPPQRARGFTLIVLWANSAARHMLSAKSSESFNLACCFIDSHVSLNSRGPCSFCRGETIDRTASSLSSRESELSLAGRFHVLTMPMHEANGPIRGKMRPYRYFESMEARGFSPAVKQSIGYSHHHTHHPLRRTRRPQAATCNAAVRFGIAVGSPVL